MSGGHWNYLSYKLEERADTMRASANALEMLAVFEHELDWGACSDTCEECAKLRVMAALYQFYDDYGMSTSAAIAIARDNKQNRCPDCEEYEKKKKEREAL